MPSSIHHGEGRVNTHLEVCPLTRYLRELHQRFQSLAGGKVATYIPELGNANPDHFGICVVTAVGLWDCEPRTKVLVAGVVTHRQRPMTAQGVTFMNLEDETGLINIVVSKGCWARYRKIARGAPALLIRGRLERSEGVINISAEELTPLVVAAHNQSRDFR